MIFQGFPNVALVPGRTYDECRERLVFLQELVPKMDGPVMARPFPGLEWADMPAQIVGDLRLLARPSANQSSDMRTISARNVIQYLDSITQDASGRLDPERVAICGYARFGSDVIVARKIPQNFLIARAR